MWIFGGGNGRERSGRRVLRTHISNHFREVPFDSNHSPRSSGGNRSGWQILLVSSTQSTERISFEVHDFFQTRKTVADAYLLRMVLHDWPDHDAEPIVRKLLPALRPRATILIMDSVIPGPGMISPYLEKYIRAFRMFSAKERRLSELKELVEGCVVRPGVH